MNDKSTQSPTSDPANPDLSLQTDLGNTVPDENNIESKPYTPLVDVALQQVAERDDGIGNSVSEDLTAIKAEVESLSQRAVVSAQKNAVSTVRSTRGFVYKNPLASLGLAATLGYALGLMRKPSCPE
ncbi:hypothetical protein [Agrobacterium rosae]